MTKDLERNEEFNKFTVSWNLGPVLVLQRIGDFDYLYHTGRGRHFTMEDTILVFGCSTLTKGWKCLGTVPRHRCFENQNTNCNWMALVRLTLFRRSVRRAVLSIDQLTFVVPLPPNANCIQYLAIGCIHLRSPDVLMLNRASRALSSILATSVN